MFGSKAETLERLSGKLSAARILPQYRFSAADWASKRSLILSEVAALDWAGSSLIVRSSARDEDGEAHSLAGHYKSVLGVRGIDNVEAAIAEVIASFEGNGRDQVFIQPMVENVRLSGVAFNRDPSTGADYVVVNYDDRSGLTDSVTGGSGENLKTFYCFREQRARVPDELEPIFHLLQELEGIFEARPIDVEFAIDAEGTLYLFQVRPLPMTVAGETDHAQMREALGRIHAHLNRLFKPHPYLHGSKNVLGVMPDWNPAEIIGQRPSPLALSLYKELITDNIWAYQRDNYGYRNLRSFPLMHSLSGQPFIDVRVSFNSFVPADIDQGLASRLVNYYIDRLIDDPSNHDKTEFEIVFSCYTMDLPQRLQILHEHGFGDDDRRAIEGSLRNLTNRIIHHKFGLWRGDIDRILELERRQAIILKSDLTHIEKIYWLIEDCKRYGTLPFAGLARAGFIAVQILQSLVAVGVLSKDEYDEFMRSLRTVSSRMARDLSSLNREDFLKRYGHLRPGTYDLLSRRYDEAPDLYFNWTKVCGANDDSGGGFSLTERQSREIQALLDEHGLEYSASALFDFIKAAIEGREHAKFVFSRSLSDAIKIFQQQAGEYGFSDHECAHADILCIHRLYSSSDDIETVIGRSIEDGRQRIAAMRMIQLPPLITSPDDVWAFHIPPTRPNFITMKSVMAPVVRLNGGQKMDIEGTIVMIENADPGYDWIFSHSIKGLITEYGGVNSHMAIRAAELGVPAVIGAGNILFRQWATAEMLEINCSSEQVRVLR